MRVERGVEKCFGISAIGMPAVLRVFIQRLAVTFVVMAALSIVTPPHSGSSKHPGSIASPAPALFVAAAYADDRDDEAREMRRQARQQAKEQANMAREMAREAQKLAKEQARDAAKQEREAAREVEKQAKEQAKEAARQQREAAREAEKQAKEQAKEATRQQRDAAREAEKQSKEQAKEATRQQREAAREAEKQSKEQAKEATRQQREASREQRSNRGSERDTASNPETKAEAPSVKEPQRPDNASSGQLGTPATESAASSGGTSDDRQSSDDGQNQSAGSGDQQDTANEGPESGDQVAETDAGTPAAEGPALTIEKLLVQLAKPKKPEPAKKKQAVAKAKPADTGRLPAQDLSEDFPEFGRPEVLAVNASAKTLAHAKSLGFKPAGTTNLDGLGYSLVRLQAPPGMSAAAAQSKLSSAEPEATVAVNQHYTIYRTASDGPAGANSVPSVPGGVGAHCGIDHCFGRDIIGWRPELRSCVSGLAVGIIDTSVDVSHVALKSKKIKVQHLSPDGAPGPDDHGTGVTSLLAGDPASGTPGLIPDASFFVADIFRTDRNGLPVTDTLSMLRAFNWLESKRVRIVNMSLSGPPDDLIRAAIKKLSAKGVVFVAAAGNGGPHSPPSYPAAYDEVIAVTAVGKNLKNYKYANRGSYIDVAAPGVAIWTALPGSRAGYNSGTSFAAPYVTAALAAIYSQLPVKAPSEVLAYFAYRDLGSPGPDPVYGQGLLVAPSGCNAEKIAKSGIRPVPADRNARQADAAKTIKPSISAANLGGPENPAMPEHAEVLPWLVPEKSQN